MKGSDILTYHGGRTSLHGVQARQNSSNHLVEKLSRSRFFTNWEKIKVNEIYIFNLKNCLFCLFDASTCTVSSINTTNLFLLVCFMLMGIVSEIAVMSRFRKCRVAGSERNWFKGSNWCNFLKLHCACSRKEKLLKEAKHKILMFMIYVAFIKSWNILAFWHMFVLSYCTVLC